MFLRFKKVVSVMQCNTLLNDEKAKLLTLIKKKFVKLDFSKIISVVENNLNDPLWMDIYILIYKSQLPPDIKIYDILLNKLSTPIFRINFAINNQVYMANIDNRILSRYIWYLITNDSILYRITVCTK